MDVTAVTDVGRERRGKPCEPADEILAKAAGLSTPGVRIITHKRCKADKEKAGRAQGLIKYQLPSSKERVKCTDVRRPSE